MVNETNKPQEIEDNEQLGQRLAASNEALANMQAEHRQLLEEMEQLRKRAETLQRIREQQEREDQDRLLEYQRNLAAEETTLQRDEETNNTNTVKQEEEEDNAEENPEEANYIKEKLAEIARLKAQFKRVQHMISTTELIENHINKNQATEKPLQEEIKKEDKIITAVAVPVPAAVSDPAPILMPNMPSMADLNNATTSDEKEQLILTMLNMFQDFSSDLKSQADDLRAERERIRELKESIIRSRKEKH